MYEPLVLESRAFGKQLRSSFGCRREAEEVLMRKGSLSVSTAIGFSPVAAWEERLPVLDNTTHNLQRPSGV